MLQQAAHMEPPPPTEIKPHMSIQPFEDVPPLFNQNQFPNQTFPPPLPPPPPPQAPLFPTAINSDPWSQAPQFANSYQSYPRPSPAENQQQSMFSSRSSQILPAPPPPPPPPTIRVSQAENQYGQWY